MHLSVVDGVEHGQRDARRRVVAVLVDRHDYALALQAQPFAGGVDYAEVRLMWDEEADVLGREAVARDPKYSAAWKLLGRMRSDRTSSSSMS